MLPYVLWKSVFFFYLFNIYYDIILIRRGDFCSLDLFIVIGNSKTFHCCYNLSKVVLEWCMRGRVGSHLYSTFMWSVWA